MFKPTHRKDKENGDYLNFCECWEELRIVGQVVPYRISLLCGLGGGNTFSFTGDLWEDKRKDVFLGSVRCKGDILRGKLSI